MFREWCGKYEHICIYHILALYCLYRCVMHLFIVTHGNWPLWIEIYGKQLPFSEKNS